ncbi:hypothetical protein E2C01_041679 [Portunus trituberculatus]|uniref:Uncharacterized protein n=1 Tax=Portunus trituberculatus TaxID=210409 RepID=A0A5B7FSH8_PORTR|nr:hypothetical protein [Portunus trituberculatus]
MKPGPHTEPPSVWQRRPEKNTCDGSACGECSACSGSGDFSEQHTDAQLHHECRCSHRGSAQHQVERRLVERELKSPDVHVISYFVCNRRQEQLKKQKSR